MRMPCCGDKIGGQRAITGAIAKSEVNSDCLNRAAKASGLQFDATIININHASELIHLMQA